MTLQRRVILEPGRWSVREYIPTLERGNDDTPGSKQNSHFVTYVTTELWHLNPGNEFPGYHQSVPTGRKRNVTM